ncbi:MAG: T9SS C-terminal target domain-containing protein [Saprospirales bacterium]|nr:MAG: T9SS C-terminal target domain-containing protein [Saprospirales bacterium]
MMMQRLTIFSVIFLHFTFSSYAQTADLWLISPYGHDFQNEDYQISASAGEFVIETHQSGDYILTQGFHQTFDSRTPVVEVLPDLELMVYPNPFKDVLLLKLSGEANPPTDSWEIKVTDVLGRKIHREKPDINAQAPYQIQTDRWASGVYFFNVRFTDLKEEKSFKLIKK